MVREGVPFRDCPWVQRVVVVVFVCPHTVVGEVAIVLSCRPSSRGLVHQVRNVTWDEAVGFFVNCAQASFHTSGVELLPLQLGYHIRNTGGSRVVIENKPGGTPLDFVEILDVVVLMGIPDCLTVFNDRPDESFISDFFGRSIAGEVKVGVIFPQQ